MSYTNRRWLNSGSDSSTGSVVAFHGESAWELGDKITFLEISDCHNKVRLHRTTTNSVDDFIIKMETLRDVIDDYISYLQKVKHEV